MEIRNCKVCGIEFESEDGLVSCPAHSFGETDNFDLNEEQTEALDELVKTNEMFKGYRVVIDYAIRLAAAFTDDHSSHKRMTDYVEKLYSTKYPI